MQFVCKVQLSVRQNMIRSVYLSTKEQYEKDRYTTYRRVWFLFYRWFTKNPNNKQQKNETCRKYNDPGEQLMFFTLPLVFGLSVLVLTIRDSLNKER